MRYHLASDHARSDGYSISGGLGRELNPQRLELTTRLNGTVVQHDTTEHMIFDVATIIEYLSTVTWLEPGDIIATGTPDGVGAGRKPPLWMKGGDKVEVEISGIGTLAVNVVDE